VLVSRDGQKLRPKPNSCLRGERTVDARQRLWKEILVGWWIREYVGREATMLNAFWTAERFKSMK